MQGASDISLLNVTFSQGSDTGSGHVFLTTTSPTARQPRRFRVENTVFPPLVGSYAIQIHTNVTSYDRYVYRSNRFDQGILDPAPYVGLIACGNAGRCADVVESRLLSFQVDRAPRDLLRCPCSLRRSGRCSSRSASGNTFCGNRENGRRRSSVELEIALLARN